MTDDLTKHVAALRARIPDIAIRCYDVLRCPAWSGWKPRDIGEVQHQLHQLLDAVVCGATTAYFGGLAASIIDTSDGPGVRLAFEAEWIAQFDPFEGTIAVVGG